ncbi:histidine--tRNA ligase [Terrihabitans soli]|uniref:Histidine--tRNA ligase n=1 Tax=Terrihabitans soli TaxID=708113 RepID=A0A6S6QXB9_9HYPH|nr:histidine--tRNA ligase [Terrihabitans soli]BCJ91690.1 histidine--tRNA ligase [Terrihabitans soli]
MSSSDNNRLKARLARGFADRGPTELAATRAMVETIRETYELWGFEALETPFIEYTDALGKFLPDLDRPNEGVFSFQDDDEQWLSLRYDLTAPLARYAAENWDRIPKPFRTYRFGPVFRNEKPGPGRFRQFLQFDADTVGAASVVADAEMCMMAADTLEKLGIQRGQYAVKINNRKVLDGVMESAGVSEKQKLTVLRAIDKLDRLGEEGVKLLLGKGRKDESGDFTKGAGLDDKASETILAFVGAKAKTAKDTLTNLKKLVGGTGGEAGVAELTEIADVIERAGYADRVIIDPSVVRGLEYYTGPVYEAELTFEVKDEKGQPIRFGSVGGGGRYDGLIARFRGEAAPATGFSIGVSRLQAALAALGKAGNETPGPVVILVMDKDRTADYLAMAKTLRDAKIPAEIYMGSSGMNAQMKYADRRRSPVAVIQGSNEKDAGEVTIKDLVLGKEMSKKIEDRAAWTEERPGQVTVKEEKLVETVRAMIARQK